MWTEQFTFFQQFLWMNLVKFPEWTTVKSSFDTFSTKTSFDMESKSSEVFKQFGYIKNYCNEEKINYWNANKVPADIRWVEIFKHLNSEFVPFTEFSSLIEYVLCFPGTTSPVERVFSEINNIWTKEKSQLEIETIKSILFVKKNMEYTCEEFYEYIKNRPDILRQISSQEKYQFKQQPKPTIETSPGAMSIDS